MNTPPILLSLILLLLPSLSAAEEAVSNEIFSNGFESGDFSSWTRQTLRVLFIGNSYTAANGLSTVIQTLGEEPLSGVQFETARVTPGGYSWGSHAVYAPTLDAIDLGWDFVVLQDQSLQPLYYPTTIKAAAISLDTRIRDSGGRTVLFMTWPRAYHGLQTQHYYPLYYNHHGDALDARVAPVGRAWVHSRHLNPALALHTADDSHPNVAGSYLAACVLFATLTGQNPTGLSSGGLNLADTSRDFLQSVAWNTVHAAKPPRAAEYQAQGRLSSNTTEDGLLPPGLSPGDTDSPLGQSGGATHFDGSRLMSIPWSPKISPTESFTFSLWAYRADWTVPTASLQTLVSNPQTFGLFQDGLSLYGSVLTVDNASAVSVNSDTSLLSPGWHHFALSYDGAQVRLWLDGTESAAAPATGALDPGSETLSFSSLTLGSQSTYPGPDSASEAFADGALADFKLFHQAIQPRLPAVKPATRKIHGPR